MKFDHSTAATEGFDYIILRPGRLVGGPFTNTDVAALLKVNEGSRKQITVERGDALNGDAARIACAEFAARVRLCVLCVCVCVYLCTSVCIFILVRRGLAI